jgi:methionyl-tRNA formyltransferase
MGTPEFAVAPLKKLVDVGFQLSGIITAPDKPAGRGKKITSSAVKEYSQSNLSCPILQPTNLKDPLFIKQLSSIKADIFIVVAFRMLPEVVWSLPRYGTINLHASLLPQYRGAAPINWSIINGEETTGVSSFLIDQKIDTGRILLQETVPIDNKDTAGTLHDKLMISGSNLLVSTIDQLIDGSIEMIDQNTFNIPESELKKAPKIFKEDCRINWDNNGKEIYNFIRGLSPFPGAYTILRQTNSEEIQVKIFESDFLDEKHNLSPGIIVSDNKSSFKISAKEGFLEVISLQLAGKKRMKTGDFLRGLKESINGAKLI